MALVTRARPCKPARTEGRYHPGDTPYPYRDCRKAITQLGTEAGRVHRPADVEERLTAQVDILRMALETIAATWLNVDGGGPTRAQTEEQRAADQLLARLALRNARALDDDRTKKRFGR